MSWKSLGLYNSDITYASGPTSEYNRAVGNKADICLCKKAIHLMTESSSQRASGKGELRWESHREVVRLVSKARPISVINVKQREKETVWPVHCIRVMYTGNLTSFNIISIGWNLYFVNWICGSHVSCFHEANLKCLSISSYFSNDMICVIHAIVILCGWPPSPVSLTQYCPSNLLQVGLSLAAS